MDKSTGDLQGYYSSTAAEEFHCEFQDFDDPAILHQALLRVKSSAARNFVLDFGDDDAFLAFDLAADFVAALIRSDRPSAAKTRWINVWYPSRQRDVLATIGRRYDFTPRLLALMCSEPRETPEPLSFSSTQQALYRPWSHQTPRSLNGSLARSAEPLDQYSISSADSARSGDFYALVNEVWHYTSVDFGRNYICVGYNTLYSTKHGGRGIDDRHDARLPHCKRVWTWLVLCSDNTVVMLHEDPFPYAKNHVDPWRQFVIAETRRNVVNVFRSLSTVSESALAPENPMTLFPIRKRLGDTLEETVHHDADAPGLLFFYLFENWHNNYTLVTRRESHYAAELESIRREMFGLPKLCHIDRMDRIGSELGVLKRHYHSYECLIDRLMERRDPTAVSLKASKIAPSQSSIDTIRGPAMMEDDTTLGVSLSSAAIVRFERMKDLINTCALSEVEDYLKAKDSLVAMNFNLSSLKQSQDTERLTRVGLLITKATILFLPINLMSAYFSINLQGVEYTAAGYWISFAVVLVASWAALFLFGVFSGTMETKSIFRSSWRACVGAWAKVSGGI